MIAYGIFLLVVSTLVGWGGSLFVFQYFKNKQEMRNAIATVENLSHEERRERIKLRIEDVRARAAALRKFRLLTEEIQSKIETDIARTKVAQSEEDEDMTRWLLDYAALVKKKVKVSSTEM